MIVMLGSLLWVVEQGAQIFQDKKGDSHELY